MYITHLNKPLHNGHFTKITRGTSHGPACTCTCVLTILGYTVVHFLVVVEMKWLKRVEYEVAHVLIHVGLQDSTVKVIYCTSSVHHLHTGAQRTCV